ncbi:MAG: ABC transporter ATP-binding protein/permease [Candidatus Rokubacteria bacterium]|nr:ABC transporter ATP-binding protein/permease [Candidatus Rokubacteria bacterium]
MSPARRIVRHLARYRVRYALGVVCLLLATGCALAIPWTVKSAVDALGRGEGRSTLGLHVGLILLLAAGHGAARLGSRFAIIGAGQWVEHDVRRDLFAHLQTLPPVFYQAHRTGDLMSRASSDIAALRILAGFGAVMLASTSFTVIGTVAAMWHVDPALTLWALSPFPVLVALAVRFNHTVHAQSTAVQEELGALSARVQENLTGMAVVRAYTMEAAEIARFRGINREYLARSLALARTQASFSPLMALVSGLGTLVILWLGGRAVVDGRISLGAFVAFNAFLAQLAWPTIALGWTLGSVRRGVASMARIAQVLETKGATAEPERTTGPGPTPAGTAIDIRHLTFAYPGRPPALRDVTLTIPDGRLVAVVGMTGSGKTTLGVLLCRLYEPPAGAIRVGGVDVRDIPLAILRQLVAYVPQEPFLFSRSLRENLRLARPDADEAELRRSAAIAGVGDEVEGMPDGWDTVVGERGLTLSGGQRARATLARALVADPPVLVLDDPFAAVDPGKEWEIFQALRSARRGRTTLLITHRLRGAQEADLIAVLAEGRVVERGGHAELLAAAGLYARLWRIQQLEEELADRDAEAPR